MRTMRQCLHLLLLRSSVSSACRQLVEFVIFKSRVTLGRGVVAVNITGIGVDFPCFN